MKKSVFLLSAIILLAACSGKNNQSALDKMDKDVFTVTAQTVQKRDISQDLPLTGTVKAWEEATIYPRVQGKLLRNVLKEGDNVSRNQTLALIERDEVGAVYEPAVVPSTISGVVGKMFLDPGDNVTLNTPIALVVNQNQVRISVDIPERYASQIKLGQKGYFTLEAYGDKKFDAQVYKISPVVDELSRVVTAELKANNPSGLIKTGMFAKVALELQNKRGVLSVPVTALDTDKDTGKTYIYIINGDTVSKAEVQTGLANDDYQEIKSGVKDGQQIADVVFGIKDGSKIKIEGK